MYKGLTNNLQKCKSKHQMLWGRTYLNENNPCNVYLYISRNNHSGTMPISVPLFQYLSTLSEYDISLQSLNIPSVCPTFADQQASKTAYTLWNIAQAQLQLLLKHSTVSTDINVNSSINNKLDWILTALNGSNDSNKVKQLQ
eukprot:68075_1